MERYCFSCMRPLSEGEVCACGDSGRKRVLAGDIPAGTVLRERYLVGYPLGRGGFGTTYIGRDLNLDMKIAVKAYSDRRADSRKQLVREARSMAKFASMPGIVNVRDFFEEQETAFIVMEYLEGVTLREEIAERGVLTEEEARYVISPVLDVLEKIHGAEFLHRDVSPDNVMVLKDGSVKLLDFGSARDVSADADKTMTFTLKPGYAAAEQYRGKEYQGTWTDVYGVAGTLYKCVTGVTPQDSLQRAFSDELKSPSELGVSLSPAFENAIMRGLALDPANRIASIPELREALLEELPAENVSNERESAGSALQTEGTVWERPTQNAGGGGSFAEPESYTYPEEEAFSGEEEENRVLPEKSSGRPGRKRGIGKWIAVAAAAAVLVLLAVFVLPRLGSSGGSSSGSGWKTRTAGSYRKAGSDTARITSQETDEVTVDMLRSIEADPEATKLYISTCSLSDECVEEIAGMTHLTALTLNNVTGFTTLTPLARSAGIEGLEIAYPGPFPGNDMFQASFPVIKRLVIQTTGDTGKLTGGSGFLANFPACERLDLAYLEGLSEISGVASMNNLTDLILSYDDNPNPDLSLAGENAEPLSHLSNLSRLYVSGVGMDSLEYLKDCGALYELKANDDQIQDLTPLAGKESLTFLELNGNPVSDLAPLSECPRLTVLTLRNAEVSDLTPLHSCEKLNSLNVTGNQIETLAGLEGLRLDTLYAGDNEISDISALSGNSTMLRLNLRDNQIGDFSACSSMIKLLTLNIAGNGVTDLTPFANSAKMTSVNVSRNRISDLSIFSNGAMPELERLDISENEVRELTPLSGCTKMELLTANNNRITSAKGLETMALLKGVILYSNQITDISNLPTETLLYVDAADNQITDISHLKDLVANEQALILNSNQIRDISALKKGTRYRKLVLYDNPVTSIDVLLESEGKMNGYSDCFYVSYFEGLSINPPYKAGYDDQIYFVDVPSDKQGAILKEAVEIKSFGLEPQFISKETADQNIDESREKISNAGSSLFFW